MSTTEYEKRKAILELARKYEKIEADAKEAWEAEREFAEMMQQPFDKPAPGEPEITDAKDLEVLRDYIDYFQFTKKWPLRRIKREMKTMYNLTIN